jgi:hypothetical protein
MRKTEKKEKKNVWKLKDRDNCEKNNMSKTEKKEKKNVWKLKVRDTCEKNNMRKTKERKKKKYGGFRWRCERISNEKSK